MKKTVQAGIHLFYWIFSFLLIFLFIRASFHSYVQNAVPVKFNILGMFLSVAGFYSGYYYLFTRYLAKLQVRKTIWRSILISAGIAVCGTFLTSAFILPSFDVLSAFLLIVGFYFIYADPCDIRLFYQWIYYLVR